MFICFSHLERVEEVRPELDEGDVLVQPAAAGSGEVGDTAAADSPAHTNMAGLLWVI